MVRASGSMAHHRAESILVQRVELVAQLDRTFLRGIVVLIDGSPFLGTHLRHPLPERESRQRGFLIEELLFRKLFHSEELPPFDLLFAPMPVQGVSEEPARGLLGRAVLGFCRQIPSQRVEQCSYALLVSGNLFARRRIFCVRAAGSPFRRQQFRRGGSSSQWRSRSVARQSSSL